MENTNLKILNAEDNALFDAPYFNIRYAMVSFELEIINDTELVRDKSSAIRGGIGEMLLRSNCISDRNCDKCGFKDECIVQRIMYSAFKEKPDYMHSGDSVGYIISCVNTQKKFESGEKFSFSLYLFGKNIIYFSQYVNAVFALGQYGLGKNKSRFMISSIINMFKEPILTGNDIIMANYKWQTLGDYITYRRASFDNSGNRSIKVVFETPTEIKFQGKMIKSFSPDALGAAIKRRLIILAFFENINCGLNDEVFPGIIDQSILSEEVYRFSNRKNQKIRYEGICGLIELENVSDEWLDMILACEIVHIGKNTSFGFGKVKVER